MPLLASFLGQGAVRCASSCLPRGNSARFERKKQASAALSAAEAVGYLKPT